MAARPLRVVLTVLVLALGARAATAQNLAFAVLADAEGWKTDSGSFLLARNGGDPQAVGRITAWGTWQPTGRLSARVLVEAAAATGAAPTHEFQLAELRYAYSRALVVEAGKILMPVGAFGSRRFSNVNPLIAAPDLYFAQYPLGAVASGAVGPLDYRAAVVSEAVTNPRYIMDAALQPTRDTSLRPVLGLGVSLGPSLRIGTSFTRGPYLGSAVDPQLPAGTSRRDFAETIAGVDARWSRGYVEVRGEYVWSRYEIPTVTDPVDGEGMYVEMKVTASPRIFVAGRFEINDYTFVLPVNPFFWVGTKRKVIDGEIGFGYRLASTTLIKASYRRDSWPDPDPPGLSFPDGYAFAVQLSHAMSFGW